MRHLRSKALSSSFAFGDLGDDDNHSSDARYAIQTDEAEAQDANAAQELIRQWNLVMESANTYAATPAFSVAERAAGIALVRALEGATGTVGPPVEVPNRTPPTWAKTYYKAVAAVDNGKRYVSVYDGMTEYAVGSTVFQPHGPNHTGGLYVYRTAEACLRADEETFPSASAMLNQPRALARVKAWNETRDMEPIRYGDKLAYAFVQVEAILPYPVSWKRGGGGSAKDREARQQTTATAPTTPDQTTTTTTTTRRAPTAAAAAAAAATTADVTLLPLDERHERRRVELRRRQAATIRLEEEVRAMERRLGEFRTTTEGLSL